MRRDVHDRWHALPLFVLASACTGGPVAEPEVSVELSEDVSTVASVEWTQDLDSPFAEFSLDGVTWRRSQAERQPKGEWRAVLVGMRAATDYQVRVGGTQAGEAWLGEAQTLTTGGLPADFPELVAQEDDEEGDDGYLALGLISQASWAVLLDADGYAVWWSKNPNDGHLTTRVRPSRDGRSVYYNSAKSLDIDAEKDYAITRVGWGGKVEENVFVARHHHDFLELPSGELAWLGDDLRAVDEEYVHGDEIVVRSTEGTERVLWSAWDHFDYADFAPERDFVHANALHYDADSGSLWVGLRAVNQLMQLDASTGEVLQRVLGLDGDYVAAEGDAPVGQHSFTVLPGGVVLHDNRNVDDALSRVVEYELSSETGEADLVWEYAPVDGFAVAGLGDALRLPGGDTIAVWSTAGVIDRVDASANRRARFSSFIGTALGYGHWVDTLSPLPPAR